MQLVIMPCLVHLLGAEPEEDKVHVSGVLEFVVRRLSVTVSDWQSQVLRWGRNQRRWKGLLEAVTAQSERFPTC